MNLKMKFAGIAVALLQAPTVFSQTPQEVKNLNKKIASYAALCTSTLTLTQSTIPRYKTLENDQIYNFYFKLGQDSVGVSRFFKMADDRVAPMAREIGQLDALRKKIPEYIPRYLATISMLSSGADGCIKTYKDLQRNPK